MSVTWQDLEDAQAKRFDLLDRYVAVIAACRTRPARDAMVLVYRTWAKWIREWDYEDDVTTDWAGGVLDYFAPSTPKDDTVHMRSARDMTAAFGTHLVGIDNDLLRKALRKD